MIISQTPLRISFVGGGSDLEKYWKDSPGKVVSATIDKYIYAIVKGRFDDKIYLNYSKKEIIDSVTEIEHDLIRESMKKVGIENGVEITTLADIPSEGSGLGSSSSVIVGLLNALYAYKGIQVTSKKLAEEACDIEINILGKPIGKQDQYAAAYGGLNIFTFNTDGSVKRENIKLNSGQMRNFGSSLQLFYTGINRASSSILFDQQKNTEKNRENLNKMVELADEFKDNLNSWASFHKIGELLDINWQQKKKLSTKISNALINQLYSKAINNGAIGGKVSGAGGGGFLLLFVPRQNQNSVRVALDNYREFPFMLEPDGSKIVFNIKREYWR